MWRRYYNMRLFFAECRERRQQQHENVRMSQKIPLIIMRPNRLRRRSFTSSAILLYLPPWLIRP